MNFKEMQLHLDGYPKRLEEQKEFHSDMTKRMTQLSSAVEEVRKIAQHNEPSAKTLAMFESVKDEIVTLKETILKIADDRYAIKLVERVVFGLIALIVTAFFLGVISLVWLPK